MLFKDYHLPLLRRGLKTETRRLGEMPRYRVGGICKVQTRLYTTEYFGLVEILYRRQEHLWECRKNGGYRKEGYGTFNEYMEVLRKIHDGACKVDLRDMVWVYGLDWFDTHKVLRADMSSLQLLGAPRMIYHSHVWNKPLDGISRHPTKGGGLWTARTLADARKQQWYMLNTYSVPTRIFRCRVGRVLHKTSCRVKTAGVFFTPEDEVKTPR